MTDTKSQIQEVQRTPSGINTFKKLLLGIQYSKCKKTKIMSQRKPGVGEGAEIPTKTFTREKEGPL